MNDEKGLIYQLGLFRIHKDSVIHIKNMEPENNCEIFRVRTGISLMSPGCTLEILKKNLWLVELLKFKKFVNRAANFKT